MRRRRTRRRKAKRNKQIIIISTMCLLFCLCAGYAAFQTNISITAKGNVVCAGEDAKDKILANSLVESGSGLYEDSYENDRYVYRGSDVDNYITFNNQTWRIIAIESNGTLKIMKDSSIGSRVFDASGNRDKNSTEDGGTYCSSTSYGCNVWAATTNMVGTPSEFVNASTRYSGTVLLDSSLNTYLNNTYYYEILSEEVQSLIVDYTYNIGGVSYTSSLDYTVAEMLEDEDNFQWKGKVALINLSDYIRSNSNDGDNCNTLYGNYSSTYYYTCRTTTWMYTSLSGSSYWWTITPYGTSEDYVWNVSYSGGDVSNGGALISYGVQPVVHLTSDLKLCGSGTSDDPYTIVA